MNHLTLKELREKFEKYFITDDGDYAYVANDVEGTMVFDWFIKQFSLEIAAKEERLVEEIEKMHKQLPASLVTYEISELFLRQPEEMRLIVDAYKEKVLTLIKSNE